MLGKLIKHEFKAVNRLMIPLHLGLIIITVIGRFYVQFALGNFDRWNSSYNVWNGIIDVTLISFYIIALIAVYVVTFLYLDILRPRKNFFTDEGYLTHTLPVPVWNHIVSKLIVALVWGFIDAILLVLSVISMFINMDVITHFGDIWNEIVESFPNAFGVPFGIGMLVLIIIGILGSIGGILIYYMCLAIGHSFNSHRILASIGIYVGINMISSLVSSLFLALFGIGNFNAGSSGFSLFFFGFSTVGSPTTEALQSYFWATCCYNALISIITIVGAFLLTNYFMTKRLNLE